MKKIYVIFFIIIYFFIPLTAQYQAANWPMIYSNAVIKNTSDSFIIYSLPYCPYTYGCNGPYGFCANASISDSAGNLLLYSFGTDIRNQYGNVIEGGKDISYYVNFPNDTSSAYGVDPHVQGALLLPRPNANGQYYLFIKDMDTTNGQPRRVTATLIDAAANNDSGKVIRADLAILWDTLSDARMTAVKHANGRDWWLINHQYLTNKIFINLITPDSIYGPFEQDIGLPGLEPDRVGWSIFSVNGNNFATTTGGMGAISILDFDRCGGSFSNLRTINTSNDTGYYFYMAFSPSGRFLYAGNDNYIMQYDLQDTDSIIAGVEVVYDSLQIPLLGMMALMPDNKIYISGWTVIDSLLSVIDSPDLKCPACGFHLRSVVVPNSVLIQNVPNFPNYNLGARVGSGCDTLTDIRQQTLDTKLIQVQPNPAKDYTTVYYNIADWSKGAVYLELCNTLGQTVYTQPLPMYSGLQKIDVSGLASGMYVVFIKRGGAVIATSKLVKQ